MIDKASGSGVYENSSGNLPCFGAGWLKHYAGGSKVQEEKEDYRDNEDHHGDCEQGPYAFQPPYCDLFPDAHGHLRSEPG